MTKFISKNQTVVAINDVNVRVGSPSTVAPALSFPKGTVFSTLGTVSDGDAVRGIARWYKCTDGNYLWSGNAKVINETGGKILCAPLPYLECTQKFGERPSVYKKYGSPKGHNGLDFRTWVNHDSTNSQQDVFSVLDGKVTESDFDETFKGNYIRIQHDLYESVYLHLSKCLVQKGAIVKSGEKIGISGNTGSVSEAPHLHFGLRPISYDKDNGYMGYADPALMFINEIKFV